MLRPRITHAKPASASSAARVTGSASEENGRLRASPLIASKSACFQNASASARNQLLRQQSIPGGFLQSGPCQRRELDRADHRQLGAQAEQPLEPRQRSRIGQLVQSTASIPSGNRGKCSDSETPCAAGDDRDHRQVERLRNRTQVAGKITRSVRSD